MKDAASAGCNCFVLQPYVPCQAHDSLAFIIAADCLIKIVRPVTRLAWNIYMKGLYEEDSNCHVTHHVHAPSSKRLPKYPNQQKLKGI